MTITVDELVSREVFVCLSGLMGDLMTLVSNADQATLQNTGLDYGELLDLCAKDEYEEAVEWYIDNDMSRAELIEALEHYDVEDERDDDERRLDIASLIVDLDDQDVAWPGVSDERLETLLLDHLKEEDELQNFANEHNVEPYRREAYEHWAVTTWLGEKLKEHGEMIGDVGNLVVWGRTTTGQMISMDRVINEIWKELTA